MRSNKIVLILAVLVGLCLLFAAGLTVSAAVGGPLLSRLRPQPAERNETLFPGVEYVREVRSAPRPMVIHVIRIDLRQPGLSFLVTPPDDPQADLPLHARTTSEFLDEFGVQVAINGDGFTPWRANGPLDYYPRSGDPVAPTGLAASRGEVYSENTDNEPVLYISRTNKARFNTPQGKVYNAISGTGMVLERGRPVSSLEAGVEPRTAIALDKRGRTLLLVVIDGRQPGYSEGATLTELAEILAEHGGFNGMNLDGGGSSTLVIEGPNGAPQVLNRPVDGNIPGRERPVGNHLGVSVRK